MLISKRARFGAVTAAALLGIVHKAVPGTATPAALGSAETQYDAAATQDCGPLAKQWKTLSGQWPMLVGHRGEKAFMPEHTLASYWQAALEKADYIEPDITLTKDGHLVVNHNEWLSENTNVASIPELAHLRTSKTWDDGSGPQNVTDEWFVVDMTLEQIKMLRVHQDPKYTWRPQHFNGMFGILTFEEYLQIVRNVTAELGRPYGVIPELKSPKLYNLGRNYPRYFEDRALLTLEHYGWAKLSDSVNRSAQADLQLADPLPLAPGVQLGPRAWQSFDLDTAEYLAQHSDVPVVALCQSLPWVFTPTGLDRVAKYASILSPWKDFFVAGAEPYFRANNITWDADEIKRMGGLIAAKDLAAEAHKRNLAISPYTFYDSHQRMGYLCQANTSEPDAGAAFCPKDRGEEFAHFFSLGVDYMFVENIVEASLLRAHYDDLLQAKNAA